MKLPNVASLALIAAVVAALEFIASGAEGAYTAWWVPVLVLVVGALAKAGQVYLEQAKAGADTVVMDATERKAANPVRRVLLD